jgi:dGTPase
LGVDPEVVEAACLAHDLGHPPFGHAGEKVLNKLVLDAKNEDGFEGNAQSFRVLTKVAVRFEERDGLDLTRATLAACIKYPWARIADHPKKSLKWGYYSTERDDFSFAREAHPGEQKTAEAEIMDWADDIAYSVHDLEDFHRCGAIPWRSIFPKDIDYRTEERLTKVVESARTSWHEQPANAEARLRGAYDRLRDLFEGQAQELISEPYESSREQRYQLRYLTSRMISRYFTGMTLRVPADTTNERCVVFDDDLLDEIVILKQIIRYYIIGSPNLMAQQRGQEKILTELFEDLLEDCRRPSGPKYFPKKFHYLYEVTGLEDYANDEARFARVTADAICMMTEAETIALHGRLRGTSSGSVLDPIVR